MPLNRFLVPVTLLLLLGCGARKQRLDSRMAGIVAGATKVLSGATKVEVFRIESSNKTPIQPGDPTIGGYAILARGKDQNREFASKLTDVLTDGKTYTDIYAACFSPGVAFRIWKGDESVDMIICFKCQNFYLGPQTDQKVMENASFHESPNTLRLIQLAKEAFPDDEEVQALTP